MPKGYNGRILRVDLSSERISHEEHDDDWYRTYLGGRGFNAYYLMSELPRGVDPLGPENKLMFSLGPITGAPVAGSGRNSVGAKSPLTGGYGEGEAGGYFGAELKHAGFDGIVVDGRAKRPVYLWVHDGEAELRDAGHLWGQNLLESENSIRSELGDSRIRTAQIGPAGENLVRYACVMNDLSHAAGRCGIGAVMGSKNLKAVAARGKTAPEWADPEVIRKRARWVAENAGELFARMRDLGTPGGVPFLSAAGGLPTRNFQTGVFEHADAISGETMRNTILVDRGTCYACVVHCKRAVRVGEPWNVDPAYGGPEYESMAALGSNCGVGVLEAVAKACELCNAYGLDTISTGVSIAFAMECFERGLITTKDTDGIELRFGNAEAMVQMVEKICRREGLGNLLAEGTLRAAKVIGQGAEEFAMQVKGQELPMHEPRIKQGLGVGYSLSPTGADHCHNIHDTTIPPKGMIVDRLWSMGLKGGPLEFNDIGPQKMSYYKTFVDWASLVNCLGVCLHLPYGFDRTSTADRMVELVHGTTGWDTNLYELLRVGERMNNLCRAFNVREGLSAKDDTLPKRFFQQPGDPRPTTAPLDERAWAEAKQYYYAIMGWTEDGVPTKPKLQELGLGWAAEAIGL